jgi:hypothetical protein
MPDSSDASICGSTISKLLAKNCFNTIMVHQQHEDGKLVLVPSRYLPDKILNWFYSNDLYRNLHHHAMTNHGRDYVPLDENSKYLFAFNEPLCLDFRRSEPHAVLEKKIAHIPESDDKARLRRHYAPLRPLAMEDRNTHHAPHRFQLYSNWRDGFVLMDLLQQVENELDGKPDGSNELSEELMRRLDEEGPKHPAFWKLFVEPLGGCYLEATYLLKIFCNAFSGKSAGYADCLTISDNGLGGTSKTTLATRVAIAFGGIRNAKKLGYVASSSVHMLQESASAITEEKSNLENAKWAVIDDFSVNEAKPLCIKSLHQITGGGDLSTQRKYAHSRNFTFQGQLCLTCNGFWKPDEPMTGADERRYTGLILHTRFVNGKRPDQLLPHERLKDPSIKDNPHRFIPELTFLVLAYHHIQQAWSAAGGDVHLPRPPSAVEHRARMFAAHMAVDVQDLVEDFFKKRLTVYQLNANLPSSFADVYAALRAFASETSVIVSDEQLRDELRNRSIALSESKQMRYIKACSPRTPGQHMRVFGTHRSGVRGIDTVYTLVPTNNILEQLNAASM